MTFNTISKNYHFCGKLFHLLKTYYLKILFLAAVIITTTLGDNWGVLAQTSTHAIWKMDLLQPLRWIFQGLGRKKSWKTSAWSILRKKLSFHADQLGHYFLTSWQSFWNIPRVFPMDFVTFWIKTPQINIIHFSQCILGSSMQFIFTNFLKLTNAQHKK